MISIAELVCKQDADIEQPSCQWNVRPGYVLSNFEVTVENEEYLERREAVQPNGEKDGKVEVEAQSVF